MFSRFFGSNPNKKDSTRGRSPPRHGQSSRQTTRARSLPRYVAQPHDAAYDSLQVWDAINLAYSSSHGAGERGFSIGGPSMSHLYFAGRPVYRELAPQSASTLSGATLEAEAELDGRHHTGRYRVVLKRDSVQGMRTIPIDSVLRSNGKLYQKCKLGDELFPDLCSNFRDKAMIPFFDGFRGEKDHLERPSRVTRYPISNRPYGAAHAHQRLYSQELDESRRRRATLVPSPGHYYEGPADSAVGPAAQPMPIDRRGGTSMLEVPIPQIDLTASSFDSQGYPRGYSSFEVEREYHSDRENMNMVKKRGNREDRKNRKRRESTKASMPKEARTKPREARTEKW